jgi:hypothetical protein
VDIQTRARRDQELFTDAYTAELAAAPRWEPTTAQTSTDGESTWCTSWYSHMLTRG